MRKREKHNLHSLPEHLLSDKPSQHWWNRYAHWLLGYNCHKIRREQLLSLHPSRVFAFLVDGTRIEPLSPPNLQLRLLTPQPIQLLSGQVLEYQWRCCGRVFHMKTRIEQSVTPSVLEEVQITGPFKSWKLLRRLRIASGGTWVIDDLQYELPWGCLGRFLNKLFIRRKFANWFEHRQELTLQFLLPDATKAANAPVNKASRTQMKRKDKQSEPGSV